MAKPMIEDLELLLRNLEPLKIEGRDKQGRRILRIIGKFFPGINLLLILIFYSDFGWDFEGFVMTSEGAEWPGGRASAEELLGDRNFSGARGEGILRGLRAHRSSTRR